MHYHLLTQLGRNALPAFVSDPQQVKMIRRLIRAGYIEGRLFPETHTANQFAQVDAITPLGQRVRTIFARAGMGTEIDNKRRNVGLPSDVQMWSSID